MKKINNPNNKPVINEKILLKRLTITAMLTAFGVLFGSFAFPIFPAVGFLEYDICDVFVLIASFLFGPLYGVGSSFIVATFQAFILNKAGLFGFLMNIVSTMSFVIPASIIYYFNKTKKGAVISLSVASVIMIVVMVMFNYLITPIFMKCDVSFVHSLMPFIAGFNAIKVCANSVITFFVYKHVGKLIKSFD